MVLITNILEKDPTPLQINEKGKIRKINVGLLGR